MKIDYELREPKTDINDFTQTEQKIMALMAAVEGNYKTDYLGMEKAITIRLNVLNAPKVEALAELSSLSKNLLINDLLTVAFGVLEENLSDNSHEKFIDAVNQKYQSWIGDYAPKGSN